MENEFRPPFDPARAIFNAFVKAAELRKTTHVSTWKDREINAVHEEAVRQAEKFGLRAPTREDVEAADRYANGSVDYGGKFAYRVFELMH